MTVSSSSILSANDAVLVSEEAFASADPFDITYSNFHVVHELLYRHLEKHEISQAALVSYYVDIYLGEFQNGGFSQFVFNTGWDRNTVDAVRHGLRTIGAHRHLSLFEEGAASVAKLGSTGLTNYLNSEYFGENLERDFLDTIDDRISALLKQEDIESLSAAWLRSQPNLVALPKAELQNEIYKRVAAIPDRFDRIKASVEIDQQSFDLICTLCQHDGQSLHRIFADDRAFTYDGNTLRTLSPQEADIARSEIRPAWMVITDKGVFIVMTNGRKAALFDLETKNKTAEIDTTQH